MNDELQSNRYYAELLEACLQGLSAGDPIPELVEPYPAQAYALRMDLVTASWLASQKPVLAPSGDFLVNSRRDLLGQIKAEKRRAAPPRAAPNFGLADFFHWLAGNRLAFQLVSVMLILVLLLGSFSGVAFASQSALPGERLYPVKTAVEDVRLLVVMDPVSDAGLNLNFAGLRVNEMELLVAKAALEHLETPLVRYRYQVNSAMQDLSSLDAASSRRQIERARQLTAALPGELEQHARRFTGMANQLGPDQQEVVRSAQAFVAASLMRVDQLAFYLDRLSPLAGTATPTSTGAQGEMAGPNPRGTGLPAGQSPTASLPAEVGLPSPSPSPFAFVSLTPRGFTPTTVFAFTPLPTSTSLLPAANPLPTDTPLPPANTQAPPANTAVPAPTNTPVPPPTNTPVPPPTNTLAPPPTSTPQPRDTSAPAPTATDEPKPTKKPSNTPRPTNTHAPTPRPTNPNRP